MSTLEETSIQNSKSIFKRRESEVQSYARSFPTVFDKAQGAWLTDTDGKRYLDFLCGAGSLNYGHNDPDMTEALVHYIQANGITQGLDMHTRAKRRFLESFEQLILQPRGLDYVVQFTGPTGANAVEAALKLARRIKGREGVISFTNGFHGVTLGALAVTGNEHHRAAAGVPLGNSPTVPFDGYLGEGVDTTEYLDQVLSDGSSGVTLPAAVIVECLQGEGGLNVAGSEWLRNLERVCRKHDMLLIVDDIQAGCGRTGDFFSFEEARIEPDIITLSKSLSGMGLPMAVTLIRRALDVWEPGEHNGTFRGNNHAFVTGAAALEKFWGGNSFAPEVRRKGALVRDRFTAIADAWPQACVEVRGRGMMQGVAMTSGSQAADICSAAFRNGLVIETSGADGEVVKCLAALTTSEDELNQGFDILEAAFTEVLGQRECHRETTAAA
ncbi:diaminobutyrate--2-oxoglutarate transaminase [Limibacillus halophilus]|uniref:Diaminobutyrate--2-oxoglutarate transaminase n=1 Tax=Limibacillus halophilus TaxID=1579333 RepID=A0A839SSK5_9PROT|nr:diaminobutyrate--2-oxoglutarate transaminase [Limibacillus halophilus]MBB3064764.1 diaminobutyrate-2-oxoglutarate transaminase [Limibacillus halophilus]